MTRCRSSTRWRHRTSVDDDLPELDEVVEALAERDVGRALVAVAHLTSAGFSPQQLTTDLVDHLRQGFLSLVAPELVAVSGTEREALVARAERVGLAALVRAMEVLGRAQVDMRDAPDPRVNLEVALVRLAHPEADDSPEALLARIERLEAGARTAPSAPGAPPVSGAAPGPAPGPPVARATPGPSGKTAPPSPPSRHLPTSPGRPTPRLPMCRPSPRRASRRWERCVGGLRPRATTTAPARPDPAHLAAPAPRRNPPLLPRSPYSGAASRRIGSVR